MFLNPLISLAAFDLLSSIAPEDTDGVGKIARERASALRYFFATAEMLQASGKTKISLPPQEHQARKQFVSAVGNVVRLDSGDGYTNNFKAELKRASDYQVGNNFLTTTLKKDKDYPGRPAPLLSIQGESVSLHPEWRRNLDKFGSFNSYRIQLIVWLARFESFEPDLAASVIDITNRILELFANKYRVISEAFFSQPEEISSFISTCNVTPLLVDECPDYYFLLDSRFQSISTTAVGQNVVIYGAPGTGKSYKLKQFEPSIRTVFHRDYQNSDFVGSYKPYVCDEKVTYSFVPGPFIQAIVMAINSPDIHHYLIIEEINRADAGSVFGETFQLLDRDDSGRSEYEITIEPALMDYLHNTINNLQDWKDRLYIPANLSIFATMNSADQGVQPMDSAFKRRWKFDYLPIKFDKVIATNIRRAKNIPYTGNMYSWCELAQTINAVLLKHGIEEDRLLGPFFLSNNDFCGDNIRLTICNKVFIYLWDDILRHGHRNIIFNEEAFPSFNSINVAYQEDEPVFSDTVNGLLERVRSEEIL